MAAIGAVSFSFEVLTETRVVGWRFSSNQSMFPLNSYPTRSEYYTTHYGEGIIYCTGKTEWVMYCICKTCKALTNKSIFVSECMQRPPQTDELCPWYRDMDTKHPDEQTRHPRTLHVIPCASTLLSNAWGLLPAQATLLQSPSEEPFKLKERFKFCWEK